MNRRLCLRILAAALVCAGRAGAAPDDAPPRRYALIISGISGDSEHYKRFWTTSTELVRALVEGYGYDPSRVWLLFEEKGEGDGDGVVRAKSTRKNIQAAFEALKKTLRKQDSLFIVLIGHTDYDGRRAKFNLPGRDLTDEQLARWLDALPACRLCIAVTTANSGYFLPRLSKPGRIVITATKVGREVQETVFPFGFVRAFTDPQADKDKDGALTVAEIFSYAQAYVAHFYKSRGLLRTEHAMLDDNGDRMGSRTLGPDSPDGALARQFKFEVATAF